MFATTKAAPVPVTTGKAKAIGALGVDFNADHLALAETDRFGNPVAFGRLDLTSYGRY